ncbi:class I SAM-dependent RNA methyltransferase, partial [Dietzia schimae]|nr:class I SAM-dependent RNA methyltransferase [Dietzia kunjamensis subsp. schimae]
MTQDRATDWTGRVVRLRMEGPAHGGEFVTRHEGRVVFCRGGITGELVDVLIDDDPGRAFCRGTVQAVVEASPDRVVPTCPAAAAGAGCCDWTHIASDAARGFAGRILAEQVSRIGRVELREGPVRVEIPGADPATSGWRTAARWVTGPDGVPGVRRARSRELVTEPCIQP